MLKRLKLPLFFIFTILLTLGLSLSLNYLLAAWTPPAGFPPACTSGNPGCDAPINTAANLQVKDGTLWIGGDNYTLNPGQFGLLVEKGNVGIGTTNPTQAKLHIGSYSSDTGGEARGLYVQTNTINVNTAAFSNAGGYGVALGGIGSNTFGTIQAVNLTQPSSPSRFVNLSINLAGGNVGIGTASPNARLDLGPGYGASGEKFLIYSDSSLGSLVGTKVGFYMDRFSLLNNSTFVFPTSVAYPGSYIVASKNTGTTTLVARMTVLGESGNVGIGTTTPGSKLDVAGNINLTGVLGVGTANPNSARNINSAITRADAGGYGIYNSVNVDGALTAARTNYGAYNLITSTADNTNFSNNLYANWNQVTNADGAGYNTAYGSYNYILNNDTALTNTASVGNIGYVLNNATGVLTNAYGTQGQVINNATGTISNARGVYGYVRNDDGTMTNAYGVLGQTYQNVVGGAITNAYGGYFNVGQTAGTITTGYGVYIGNTGGSTQYGLYQAGSDDTNYFAGEVGIGTTNPSGAKLQINPPASTEGLRIVTASDYSPLNIRNSANSSDIFRIDQSGILQVGQVPWARLTSFPSACASGQYVSAVGGTLTCSTPPAGTGTVTSITAGSGLSGGTITTSGTISLNLANANTWTGAQTFGANTNFPGSGVWNSSGNVGIGTTAPGRKLTVYGSGYGTDSQASTIEFKNPTYNQSFFITHTDAQELAVYDTTASYRRLRIGQGTNANGVIYVNGSDGSVIIDGSKIVTSGGNVGIGTTDPGGYKLNVQAGTSYGILGRSSSGLGVQGYSNSYVGVEGLSDTSAAVVGASGGAVSLPSGKIGVYGQSAGGVAGYFTATSGGYGLIVDQGNVGIGTTVPGTNKLEVVGGPIKATGGLIIETRTSDPASPATGQIWLRTDI